MKQGIGGWCLMILAVCIGASNALNVTTFEKFGDLPPAPFNEGAVIYANGSVYLIQVQTMLEFDVATKQWVPNRNFKPKQRDGFVRDYFALGNRIFAVMMPHNSAVAVYPLFFFWDKDAAQFQPLSVDVDPNAMPTSTPTSVNFWAISVPDKAGSDAYLAMTSNGSSTSDAAFSKLHVEFSGSIPISGEMRGFHRASLPVNILIGYAVFRENAFYWFVRTYEPDIEPSKLDTDHVHYYDFTTNATGNISTSSNSGTYYAPYPRSYIIGDNHAVTFGRIPAWNPSPLRTRQYATWIFDFDTNQWTAFLVYHAGYKGLHGESVDMVNRLVYQVTTLGVYVAKIDV